VFQGLKKAFTTEPMLAVSDLNKEMRMKVDTLDYAIGEVLSVKCKDKKWQSVVFISKLMNPTEWNYKIYNKEMLTVIKCLEA